MTTIRIIRNLILALLLAAAAGCATTNGGDSRDPLEGFNRAMYSFNDGFDNAIGKPIATAYRDVLPAPVRGFGEVQGGHPVQPVRQRRLA